jgi:hypothetical protein
MEPSGRNQWQPVANATAPKTAKSSQNRCRRVTTGCRGKAMVRRGSTVRVRQSASVNLSARRARRSRRASCSSWPEFIAAGRHGADVDACVEHAGPPTLSADRAGASGVRASRPAQPLSSGWLRRSRPRQGQRSPPIRPICPTPGRTTCMGRSAGFPAVPPSAHLLPSSTTSLPPFRATGQQPAEAWAAGP